MVVEKYPCKRHPDRYSSRRCYYCKEHICSSCQNSIRHHIFCGTWCFLKYLLKQQISRFKFSKEYTFLISIIIVFQVLMLFILRHQLHSLVEVRSEKKEKFQGVQAVDSTALGFTLDTAIVQSPPYLQISGRASSNTII